MAVAKSGKGGNEQRKRMGKVSSKKAPSLSRVLEAGLADQGQDKVMDISQNSGALPDCEAGCIFFEGHIPSVVGTRLDTPMSAADLQELPGACFLA